MFRGKRARGKGSRKPARHTDSTLPGPVFNTWRPEPHLQPVPWQAVRARLPLQQIQQATPHEHLQQIQQVSLARFSRPLIESSVTQTKYIEPPPASILSAEHPSTSCLTAVCNVGQAQSSMSLPPPVPLNLPRHRQDNSTTASTDVHQKSLPFGWLMGVLRCSCGASLCPSFGIHRCSCDKPSANTVPNANGSPSASNNNLNMSSSHCRNPQTQFQVGSYFGGCSTNHKSRIRGRSHQKGQQVQRGQAKSDGTPTGQARPINVSGLKQTRIVTTTRNVPWPFFGRRTEQLLVTGGTAFPCVHVRPAELLFDVHYSMVVDLVPSDPPLGYMASTPSARYLPPLNYLTGDTWMAHPWKLHLETIVHAVQAPRAGFHGVDLCLPDGEYTPVIRLFTTRAHTGLIGGHPSDMIEIGLRWYLTDHSFVKASLPGAEQTVLFRARRPLNSQYQQSAVQISPVSPAAVCPNVVDGGVPAPRGTSAVYAANADLGAGENQVATGRRHSYLKTHWLLSSSESRNENLLAAPSTVTGSLYTPSSRSSSSALTPEPDLSVTSRPSTTSSSLFSEEIARNSGAISKTNNGPFLSEDPALVNLFNSFFPQGFFDDDYRNHPP